MKSTKRVTVNNAEALNGILELTLARVSREPEKAVKVEEVI